jgi:hypothetical protein
MDSTKTLSFKQRLFIILNIVLGALLLTTAVLSSNGYYKKEDKLPILKDSSGIFKLISMEKNDHEIVMKVQNTSKKAITAFTKGVCGVPESSRDYSIGSSSIQPEEIVEINTPVETVLGNCDSSKSQPTITILAVIFDDKTYAGEYQWAKGILDERRGLMKQLKRINNLLAQALKWPDAGQTTALERLKEQIAALPVEEGEELAIQGGLSSAKQRALHLLDELAQWQQKSLTTQSVDSIPIRGELAGIHNLQEGIRKLISLQEKWISKY